MPAKVDPATSGPPLSPVHAERNGLRPSGSVAHTIVAGSQRRAVAAAALAAVEVAAGAVGDDPQLARRSPGA